MESTVQLTLSLRHVQLLLMTSRHLPPGPETTGLVQQLQAALSANIDSLPTPLQSSHPLTAAHLPQLCSGDIHMVNNAIGSELLDMLGEPEVSCSADMDAPSIEDPIGQELLSLVEEDSEIEPNGSPISAVGALSLCTERIFLV